MRIAINCRSFLKKHTTGIGRYARNLVFSLSDIDATNDYRLYIKKGLFDFSRQAPKVKAKNFHIKHDWLNQGLNATLGPVDLYHSPSPDTIDIDEAKIIVTVHDLIHRTYPEGHTPSTIKTVEKQFNEITSKADRIICVSKSTQTDLQRFYPIKEDKTCVVYQGVDKTNFYPLDEKQKAQGRQAIQARGIKQPFILFVGTIEPRKNLKNLLLAFSLMKKKNISRKLVVIGMKGWMSDDIANMVKDLGLKNDVVFVGYIQDQELRNFYNCADVFAYPSFYEGFGFPILEALSCGAAVVTSNASSCPEIAKDAALIVDPYNPEDIAQAIIRVLEDEKCEQELRIKALGRAEEFSFLKTAQETLRVYKDVYES
ncbi:MAG: glycosyltransferase family 1 protein [Candidatus Omnitrophota bacterium]